MFVVHGSCSEDIFDLIYMLSRNLTPVRDHTKHYDSHIVRTVTLIIVQVLSHPVVYYTNSNQNSLRAGTISRCQI